MICQTESLQEDKFVPINQDTASIRTNPITVSQPCVNTKKDVNSDSNGFSSKGVDITAKTRRPQPRSNTKNDKVPSASKSSCIKNKYVKVEEHHRNLLLSKNKKHMSYECHNIKLSIQNDKSEVVCAMCKQCLITANHDVCVLNYVNGMNSRGKKQKANASNVANQKKHKPKIRKPNKFCDSDLEVAFRRNTCFVRYLEGVDLLKGNRTTNLYTINLHDMAFTSPICLMARATSTKSWLWHQCLSHLNFDTINDLARNDLVTGLPKFKYHKEHLCPSCEQGKSKKASHPPKPGPNSKKRRLLSLHVGTLYQIKDEAPKEIKTFLKKITVLLQSLVIMVRTDNDTEFKNQVLKEYFDSVGISHQSSSVRTPQQNRRLLLRATLKTAPSFTNKTPYELINGKKPDISFLHVFGALCYPKNDCEDIGKLGAKSSGLNLTYAPSTITTQQPTERELDLLFEAMYDDYIGGQPSAATRTAPAA
ncbi:retrovirus-related pol polyprotein from transposon TNT 1-94 [Tanacetum coccineum]